VDAGKQEALRFKHFTKIDSVQHDPEETLKNLREELKLSEETFKFAGEL